MTKHLRNIEGLRRVCQSTIVNPLTSRKKVASINKESKNQVRFQGWEARMRFIRAERTLDSLYSQKCQWRRGTRAWNGCVCAVLSSWVCVVLERRESGKKVLPHMVQGWWSKNCPWSRTRVTCLVLEKRKVSALGSPMSIREAWLTCFILYWASILCLTLCRCWKFITLNTWSLCLRSSLSRKGRLSYD